MLLVRTPEEGAALGFSYAQALRELDANTQAELDRLLVVGRKIRVSGSAATALNRMADREAESYKQWESVLQDEFLPATIAILEQVETSLRKKEDDEARRLEQEAAERRAAEEAAKVAEEEAARPEAEQTDTENPETPQA